ncbi:MAG TPA: hypothetical protein VM029_07115, partial [Opitutaceae bacterium]|nr:hypothetical protein [Opitutaceae bacterium]
GRGGEIGPELTGYERTNLPNVLLSIVDPSLAIREGFATFQITTKDNRTLVGFLEERDPNRLLLRDVSGQKTPVAIVDIASEKPLPVSLMPEGLLDGLSAQELRDFIAYFTAPTDPGAATP